MKNKIKITFLGTGANGGTPQVDCKCKFCVNSTNKEKRLRSAILIEVDKSKFIVDCGPDFRQQLLSNNLRLQDVSFITVSHLHWDHCSGLVELSSGKKLNIPLVVHNEIKQNLISHQTFSFLFKNRWSKLVSKNLNLKFIKIEHDPNFPTFAIKVVENKTIIICTDIFKLNNNLIREIKKANLVIFDSTFLNKSKHWHISIKESATILSKICRNVIYTHVNHSENPEKIEKFLKRFGFKLAFDGMEVIV